MKKKGYKIFWVFYVLVLAVLGVQLFFGDVMSYEFNTVFFQDGLNHEEKEELKIGYVYVAERLDPLQFDPLTRNVLNDVYEGIVKTDRNLEIQSGLAVSWGLLDPQTWEFRLRPNVQFHDGQKLLVTDVVASLDKARFSKNSTLASLLSTISTVSASGDDRLLITTSVPDPLLLSKLATVFIEPEKPLGTLEWVGTGPYKITNFQPGIAVTLERNSDYWGIVPVYKKVVLQAIPDRQERIRALETGDIDLLSGLPPTAACILKPQYQKNENCIGFNTEGITVQAIPSLEVNFLMFNFKNTLFQDRSLRQAMTHLFDSSVFVDLAYGYAHPVGQFVSSGVFGFNPDIKNMPYDLEAAQDLADAVLENTFERVEVNFYYPETLEAIGQYVKTQLSLIGLDTVLHPLSDFDLQAAILGGDADFYYLGWRSELGDALDFLEAIAHSPADGYGTFNGNHYYNPNVDLLIEKSKQNLNPLERLLDLQRVMEILVKDDVVGVPLFESETLFAYRNSVHFNPRIDGYIYAADVR